MVSPGLVVEAAVEKVLLLTNDGDNSAALLQHHSLMRDFRPKPSNMKISLPIEATGKDHRDASET